jgi:hypothetical protein
MVAPLFYNKPLGSLGGHFVSHIYTKPRFAAKSCLFQFLAILGVWTDKSGKFGKAGPVFTT